jgi:CheY-like chemotaxis protein
MKEILDWLLYLEQLAGNVYRSAAEKFSEDKEFSDFLSDLAYDEDTHFKLLKEAEQELLSKRIPPPPAIIVDKSTKNRVVTPLENLYERIKTAPRISKQAVMKVIVAVEFAELNNIFQYVVSSFQKDENEIKKTASIIDEHIERIKKFLKKYSDVLDLSEAVRQMPTIGKEKLLIVQNKLPLQLFIAQALSTFGETQIALNGQEALKKVRNNYFNLVISDINMPVMDGPDFFRRAVEIIPGIAKNFLFCARDITPDAEVLCNAYNIKFLKIPFALNQFHKTIKTIIDKRQ